jgi:uncharacterized protein YdeI (YjbR/CyaY-like superfamily)
MHRHPANPTRCVACSLRRCAVAVKNLHNAYENDQSIHGTEILTFESPAAWHAWLTKNHASSKGIFIRIGKKDSGILSITAAEALEVALCHGWIDAIRKAGDDKTFLQRYTPRGRAASGARSTRRRCSS